MGSGREGLQGAELAAPCFLLPQSMRGKWGVEGGAWEPGAGSPGKGLLPLPTSHYPLPTTHYPLPVSLHSNGLSLGAL